MKYPRLRLLIALMMVSSATHAQALSNEPLSKLDLERYLGVWHEIAHLPMFFQRNCKDQITATYSRLPDGQIRVLNACRTKDGMVNSAAGVAQSTNRGPAGALIVRFAPAWLSWLPWVWADYWVLEVDTEYRWAVVGSPSRNYLWVLSRLPSMRRAEFDAIRARAAQRGYPVDKLVVADALD